MINYNYTTVRRIELDDFKLDNITDICLITLEKTIKQQLYSNKIIPQDEPVPDELIGIIMRDFAKRINNGRII